MIEGTPLKISLTKGVSFISSTKRSGGNHHQQAKAQEASLLLQLTLDSSTESNIRCSSNGKKRQGRSRSRVVALETGASVPRQSAFIDSIPYFLGSGSSTASNADELPPPPGEECFVQIRVVELEESGDERSGSSFEEEEDDDDGIMNNSTLFGETVVITVNPGGKSSGTSTPSSGFLDSDKFYHYYCTKYCEETVNRPKAEDLMIQTRISQEMSSTFEPVRPSNDDDDGTVFAEASEESTDSIIYILRTDRLID